MSSIIQKLLRDDDLVMWHNYGLGTLDLTGNGHNATISGGRLSRGCAQLQAGGEINVPSSTDFDLTAMTLVMSGPMTQPYQVASRFITRRESGSTNWWEWYRSSATGLVFATQSTASLLLDVPEGSDYLAVSFANGEAPEGWKDGVKVGDYATAITINADAEQLTIGNFYALTRTWLNPMCNVMMIDRKLTADEHAALYSELQALKVDSRPYEVTPDRTWFQRAGARQSVSAISSGFLEDSGFVVNSGSYKIGSEVINGRVAKTIECVTAGQAVIPTSLFQQSESEAAYGDWEFYFWVDDAANEYRFNIISDTDDLSGSAYRLFINSSQSLRFFYQPGGTLFATSNGVVSTQTWTHCQITRSGTGEFAAYSNGVLIPVTTGTNPATENTLQTSTHIVLDIDAGDKLALLSKKV